jgi:hypothetical protein
MGQQNIQQTFDNATVEGFDGIYQPDPEQAQTSPDQVQGDPILETQTTQDHDPRHGVSLEDAAKVLGLHMDTVRKRLQKGRLKGFKVADKYGDKWFVHQDELVKSNSVQPNLSDQAQTAPDLIQPYPMDQTQADPMVEIEIGPDQVQGDRTFVVPDPTLERLVNALEKKDSVIENQAYQLKAAGDVIMYLRSIVDEKDSQLKLLTDSQHQRGPLARFWAWFTKSGAVK